MILIDFIFFIGLFLKIIYTVLLLNISLLIIKWLLECCNFIF